MSDCELIINNKTIKVHSSILRTTWSFFDLILCNEKCHQTKMPFETFKKMVKYFYDCSLSDLNLIDCAWILSMADYYMIEEDDDLRKHSEIVIRTSRINESNCFDILKLSLAIHNDELRERALSQLPTIFDTQYIFSFFIDLYDMQQGIIENLEETVQTQSLKLIHQQEKIQTLEKQMENINNYLFGKSQQHSPHQKNNDKKNNEDGENNNTLQGQEHNSPNNNKT